MSKPSDSKAPARKGETQAAAGVDRRRFFLMGGSAVAAAAVVPLAGEEAAADEFEGRAGQGPLQGNRSRQELLSRQPLLMGPRTC